MKPSGSAEGKGWGLDRVAGKRLHAQGQAGNELARRGHWAKGADHQAEGEGPPDMLVTETVAPGSLRWMHRSTVCGE